MCCEELARAGRGDAEREERPLRRESAVCAGSCCTARDGSRRLLGRGVLARLVARCDEAWDDSPPLVERASAAPLVVPGDVAREGVRWPR